MLYNIRIAEKNDSRFIWEIRNHEQVRKKSNNDKIIDFEDHDKWFGAKYFSNKKNYCFVIADKKEVIGYCRLDLSEDEYLVSIAIKPGLQGHGFGGRLLNQALELSEVDKKVIAEIKKDNTPSIKIFEKNGFNFLKEMNGNLFYKYESIKK